MLIWSYGGKDGGVFCWIMAVLLYGRILYIQAFSNKASSVTFFLDRPHHHDFSSSSTSLLLSSSLSSSSSQPVPWCRARIDYSGANEYMNAHYYNTTRTHSIGSLNTNKELYFSLDDDHDDGNKNNNSITGIKMETVYNARQGIYHPASQTLRPATLSSCGFTLTSFPSNLTTTTDVDVNVSTSKSQNGWNDMHCISSIYLKEIRQNLMPKLFPSVDKNNNKNNKNNNPTDPLIRNILFWHPMLRDENQTIPSNITISSPSQSQTRSTNKTTPKTSIAPVAHIDTDIGAYVDLESMFQLIVKNQIQEEKLDHHVDQNNDDYDDYYEDMLQALQNGHRFLILNIWRNISSRPITTRSPLALLATHYNEKKDDDSNNTFFFPLSKPNMNQSLWYTFPYMNDTECLIFQQYDRFIPTTSTPKSTSTSTSVDDDNNNAQMTTSDIWHCALTNLTLFPEQICTTHDSHCHSHSHFNEEPRRSFDLRAFVILNEKVPPSNDRFLLSRNKDRRPLLSHAESGCFCDEQAEKRLKHNKR